MSITNSKADINTNKILRSFKHNNVTMLNVDIEYPNILLSYGSAIQSRINIHYNNLARNFYRYAVRTLLPNAIEQYKNSIKNGFPFNAYDAVMKYTVTQNSNCTLSTFSDRYEYTGGAHGSTIRTSDNWNLQTGSMIRMSDLFRGYGNYKALVIKRIQEQAQLNMEENPGIYFDDYKKLIVETFNPQSFNLTPDYLEVYYQQYDIAPYASGIIVFSIKYESLGIDKPCCK